MCIYTYAIKLRCVFKHVQPGIPCFLFILNTSVSRNYKLDCNGNSETQRSSFFAKNLHLSDPTGQFGTLEDLHLGINCINESRKF